MSPVAKRQLAVDRTETYLHDICYPGARIGRPDYNAPCNALLPITYQCGFGPDFDISQLNASHGLPEDAEEQSPVAQRDCACQSQFFNLMNGCLDCYTKHGASLSDDPELTGGADRDLVASASSSYCAASNTPTDDIAMVLYNVATATSDVPTTRPTASFSDPIGNMTAVSLYYTPSVRGTSAYVPAQPTAANGSVVYSSVNTVSGQIVPTGSETQSQESSTVDGSQPAGSSASSTSEGGAAETAALKLGSIGMLGFAAAVAML